MKKQTTIKSLLVASLLSSTASVMAVAQDEEGARGGIEEIVITSEKRESTISDTAIAITAFDSDMRDDLGIQGASDIANFTPGMSYNASPNRIFIRGVGRVDNSLGSEPGVAIYRDGIYTNEAASVSDTTFFVDRIEVLRGPQGTLYGRNAIGGAAAIHSKRPTDEFQGAIRGIVGSFGQQQIAASVSGPISDTIRYRIAGEKQKNDGWAKNIAPGMHDKDLNQLDFERIAAQFDWDVTDRINWWVRWSAYEWDQRGVGGGGMDPYATAHNCGHIEDYSNDFQSLVPSATCGYAGADPELGEANNDFAGFIQSPGNLATSHITYSGDEWDIKYIFGFNEYAWDYSRDYDGTSRSDLQYYEDISQHEEYMQHELQFISHLGGDVEFILGAFYYQDDLWQPYTLRAPNNPVLQTPIVTDFATFVIDGPANPEGIFYDQEGFMESKSYAGYAQVDYFLNDEWHIALGARYSKDEKEGYEKQRIVWDSQGYYSWMPFVAPLAGSWFNTATEIGGVPVIGAAAAAHFAVDFGNGYTEATHTDSWDAFTWSIGADWQPMMTHSSMLRFQQGIRQAVSVSALCNLIRALMQKTFWLMKLVPS